MFNVTMRSCCELVRREPDLLKRCCQ